MCVIDDTGNYAYIDNTAFKFPNPNIDVQKKSYIVQDTRYNIFSVHDLPYCRIHIYCLCILNLMDNVQSLLK